MTKIGGPIYNTWEWTTLCEGYSHTSYHFAAQENGSIVGVLPLIHIESKIFDNHLVSMPYSEYGSTLVEADNEEARLALLKRAAALADELQVKYLVLRGDNVVNEASSFGDFDVVNRFVTMEVDTTRSSEEVWNDCDSRFRRGVRKARKEGLEVKKVNGKQGFEQYYNLFVRTMRGHGTPPHSRSFLYNLWSELNDSVDIYLATYEGKAINGKMMVNWNGRKLYRMGVSNHEYRDLNGGSLLMWKAIEDACSGDYSTFDLGRTREGSGVYMYKKSMSPKKVWLDDLLYFPGEEVELPNPNDSEYEKLQNIWKRLPLRLTELIGPHIRKDLSL
ncbi:FemAB-like protein, PEP-CTERM system-associated [Halorubrum coriense DSM 10284]|uniref:FemAB-like protein, PEP-CTERM system-associated n=1 Tax=Halorubrum coriense DSM 10284 TaxID=1227466 RepID=M0EDG3_9EURY|nr:GNAT family N-acetyltransferase [Halorubrum coriense]ELZ44922.1 FemAB-like protein, PEP-CTERM system-associated [Halorubrum coriense DSM 10284]